MVLASDVAKGGGEGPLEEGVVDNDEADLLTLGLFSLSFSLPCEGLRVWETGPSLAGPARLPRALLPPRAVCLTVALNSGRHT